MKLEEIRDLIEANSEMLLDLEKESRRIPKLHSQAINIRSNELAILKALELEMDAKKRDRWVYYSGKAEPQTYKDEPFDFKLLKNEVDSFVDSDRSILQIKSKMEMQKIKISMVDEWLKGIQQRGFLIRSSIDYQRLMAGLS